MATPQELLAQALAKLQTANRIDGNKNSWRMDNKTEYAAVVAYLQGGSRPNATSDMGVGLVGVEDARRMLVVAPEPEPEPPPVGLSVNRATMTAAGGRILRDDSADQPDPIPLWKQILAVSASRHQHLSVGGDTHVKADGSAQNNTAFRRLTVQDGDDFYGERAALGRNWWQDGDSGTFALFREGERRLIFWSMRFPANFPMTTMAWQQIIETKQAQPYDNDKHGTRNPDGTGVTIEFQMYAERFRLFTWWQERWSAAAPALGQWIRFAADITFSQHPNVGKVTVYIDNDNDGDWLDADETFTWNGATLAYATAAHNGLAAGESIPSFLEIGPYHNSVYGTTSLDIDNVQVYG